MTQTQSKKVYQAGSYTKAVAVTPNDSTDLASTADALWIGGAGTGALTVTMADDSSSTAFAGVPVGLLKVSVKRVHSTGTGVTNIVALYV